MAPPAAVAFGDGVFLAVSRYDEQQRQIHLLSSPDALDWQVQTVLDIGYAETSALAYLGGAFVSGSLRIVREGDAWRVEPTGTAGPTDMAIGHGVLVGIGHFQRGLLVSSDGRTWAQLLNESLHELAFGSGVFLAAGGVIDKGASSGGMVSSTNGSDWTARPMAPATEIRSMAHGNGRFVALPAWGPMQTSIDGQSWTEQQSPFGPENGVASVVAFGGDKFVVLGQGGAGRLLCAISADGLNWTVGTDELRLNGYFDSRSLTYGNGRFLAIATSWEGVTALSSEDGLHWTRSGFVEADRLILAGEQFLAWQSGGAEQVWTSPDGTQWTGHRLNTDYPVYDIAYGGGLYVGIVRQWDPLSPVLVSRDLKHWRPYSPPVSAVLRGVTFANGRFYPLGENSTILRSNPIIHLQSPEFTELGARLRFSGEIARTYELQASPDLHGWESLATIIATQDRVEYLDRTDPGASPRFYRVLRRDAP